MHSLAELEITNQCVVLCDLDEWADATSRAWLVVRGTQDEVGIALALALDGKAVRRLDDFGGVCKTFLCEGEAYVQTPPKTRERGGVFSFTPKKKALAEANEMARVAKAAGYGLLILTVQKDGKFGKVWVLCSLLAHTNGKELTYYEDTNTVVDEIKRSPVGDRVTVVHVQAPGFESFVSTRADRVVSQQQYQAEVLAP